MLLSNTTRELVEDELPDGVSVHDLGVHRLKDLERPEHLSQLVIDGLPNEFPALRTVAGETLFAGREGELEQAAQAAVKRPRLYRRRTVLVGALAGVIAAAVAIPIFAIGQSGGGGRPSVEAATGDSVGVVDSSSGALIADIGVGATPSHLAVGEGATGSRMRTVTASRGSIPRRGPWSIDPCREWSSGIATGNGDVWVANSLDATVSRIDPQTNAVVQTIDVGNGPIGIVYGSGSVWVANTGDGTITRIDGSTGAPGRPRPIAATELAFGAGSLWASERADGQVARIDPATGQLVQQIRVGNGPTGIAFGSGAAWVANSLDGTVTRIDPVTNSVAATISTGNGPTAIAVGSRGVWISNQFDGRLALIDPRTNLVTRHVSVGNRPQGVATAAGNVLVSVRQSGAGHRGGTLTVLMGGGP